MPIYIGNIPQIKVRRQEIIKNIIDFINIQNKTLRIRDVNERKKRLEEAVKIYGLNKEYTQFFIFELQNDIFPRGPFLAIPTGLEPVASTVTG